MLFQQEIKKVNCTFETKDFRDFDISILTKEDFVYCDPPYLNSVATYTENKGWTKKDEQELFDLLDELNEKEVKFALSNNLKYNNELLVCVVGTSPVTKRIDLLEPPSNSTFALNG